MKNDNDRLKVKVRQWNVENPFLCEYDNTQYKDKIFEIKENGFLLRKDKDYEFQKILSTTSSTQLLEFDFNSKGIDILPNKTSKNIIHLQNENSAWMVCKGKKNAENPRRRQHKLNEGDIIKLGKVFMKICKIHLFPEEEKLSTIKMMEIVGYGKVVDRKAIMKSLNDEPLFSRKMSFINHMRLEDNRSHRGSSSTSCLLNKNTKIALPKIPSSKLSKEIKRRKILCRICYGDDNTEKNPLIYPCKCSGSMKFIHYECLKTWLTNKIEQSIGGFEDGCSISYSFRTIKCELCNSFFPEYVKVKGKYYCLLYPNHNFTKYMIFDSIRADKEKSRTISIISFNDKDYISLGRSEDCDVCVHDYSVSRNHCYIFAEDGGLYLNDNISKFGTLVLLQAPKLNIIQNKPVKLQILNNYIHIKQIQKFQLFSFCCNSMATGKNLEYYRQNSFYLNPKENQIVVYNTTNGFITDEGEDDDDEKSEKKETVNNNEEDENNDKGVVKLPMLLKINNNNVNNSNLVDSKDEVSSENKGNDETRRLNSSKSIKSNKSNKEEEVKSPKVKKIILLSNEEDKKSSNNKSLKENKERNDTLQAQEIKVQKRKAKLRNLSVPTDRNDN